MSFVLARLITNFFFCFCVVEFKTFTFFNQLFQVLYFFLISAPVLPTAASTLLPSPSAPSSSTVTTAEKKKRGRKPKVSATNVSEPVSEPVKPVSPVKMPISSHVGGPDTIRSPRGAGNSSAWRGPPAGSASFQVT